MVYAIPIALVIAVAILATRADRARQRTKILERVRAEWGRRCDRGRDFERLLRTHRSRCEVAGDAAFDDRTWDDLDLDALFAYLDRTESTLGQEALYHRLRGGAGIVDLTMFEALLARLHDDRAMREDVQIALARLQEPGGYDLWWIARPGAFDTPRWYVIFPVLAAVAMATIASSVLWTGSVLAVFVAASVNALVRLTTDRRISVQADAFGSVAPLVATGRSIEVLRGPDVAALMEAVRQDVRTLRALQFVAGWLTGDAAAVSRDATMFGVVTRDVARSVYEALSTLLLLDGNAVWFGAAQMRAHGRTVLRLMSILGDVDAAVAVASLRAGTNVWARPRFRSSAGPIVIDELRHPLIVEAVANSIALAPPHGVLVTGCNMAGKSSFVRAVGVAVVMAQTIHTCFARSYEAPLLRIRTCIGVRDDLLAGKSYYIVEVETLLECVRLGMQEAPCLFLIDELFRGTNAVERLAAGEAVLIELIGGRNGARPHVVLAATHDGELADLLSGIYETVHFDGATGPDGTKFDYRLRPGPARTRNAIALLKHLGAPERLVERALQRVGTLGG